MESTKDIRDNTEMGKKMKELENVKRRWTIKKNRQSYR
jgi:hypothetical protein